MACDSYNRNETLHTQCEVGRVILEESGTGLEVGQCVLIRAVEGKRVEYLNPQIRNGKGNLC